MAVDVSAIGNAIKLGVPRLLFHAWESSAKRVLTTSLQTGRNSSSITATTSSTSRSPMPHTLSATGASACICRFSFLLDAQRWFPG